MTLFNISFMICLFGFHTSVWCQQNHYRNLNMIYHVSSNAQNWFQAFIMCKNAGMDLASITSKDQHDKLEEYLKNNSYNRGYWLSGTNLGNGEFYWASTGTAVIYSKWLPNQPDNAKLQDNDFKGENCIQWGIYNRSENAAWNDLGCFHKLRYICEEHQYCS
ncbi:salivary C-type lectin 1-like isoform X2 [Rhynchophorus ferrugineus]|uniref:salivary C-type lectin 1-like isoform X2 n=1 Tax=Rhynchophorus ferrugineus TaxID=354439 RepID=UPI003FCC3B86